MKQKIVKLNLTTAPDNLKRNGYVLLACIDKDNKVGMGAKYRWYPENIYRLPGGGMEANEEPINSATRELKEELAIVATESEMIPLVEIIIDAETSEGNFRQYFYCYGLRVDQQKITAGDDVDSIIFLNKEEYSALNDRLERADFAPKENNNWSMQKWRDYGTLFSTIQKIVGLELSRNNLW